MKHTYLFATVLALSIFGGISCTKEPIDNSPIHSSWIVPLFNGKIDVGDLSTLVNRHYNFEIGPGKLNLDSAVSISNPNSETFYNLGNYTIETNDLIKSIALEKGKVRFILFNNFDIPLLAGTQLSFKSIGTGSTLGTIALSHDIAQGRSDTSYLDLSGKIIGNNITVSVDQLSIGSFQNIVFDKSIQFDLLFMDISIANVDLTTHQQWNKRDTVDFSLQDLNFGNQIESEDDSLFTAHITFKADNELPAHTYFQAYLIDAGNQLIDSLLTPRGAVDGAVYTGGNLSAASTSEFNTNINKKRLLAIQSASKIIYVLHLDTYDYTASEIRVLETQSFKMKISGDINLILRTNILNNM